MNPIAYVILEGSYNHKYQTPSMRYLASDIFLDGHLNRFTFESMVDHKKIGPQEFDTYVEAYLKDHNFVKIIAKKENKKFELTLERSQHPDFPGPGSLSLRPLHTDTISCEEATLTLLSFCERFEIFYFKVGFE